jgi:putative SOS response-associated peptidase YedK
MFEDEEVLIKRFHIERPTVTFKPTYNAAPGQELPTIVNAEPDVLTLSKWGFIPAWAVGRTGVKAVINARAETVATKPFFSKAFKERRCLVPADGFYEWQRTDKGKVPYRIALTTEEPFAFAGIWSTIHTADGIEQQTFAIITTTPNDLMESIHDRMPVILQERDEEDWLNPQLSLEDATALLLPFPAELMTAYRVTPKINSPAFNRPEAVQPVADATA